MSRVVILDFSRTPRTRRPFWSAWAKALCRHDIVRPNAEAGALVGRHIAALEALANTRSDAA